MKGGGRGPGTWHRNLERGLVSVHKIVLWSIAWNRAAEQAQQAHCQDCAHNRMLCVLSSWSWSRLTPSTTALQQGAGQQDGADPVSVR